MGPLIKNSPSFRNPVFGLPVSSKSTLQPGVKKLEELKMKKILSLLMGLAMIFSTAHVFAGDDGEVTKKYLVACMKCFAKHGADPASHAACDMSCSRMGTDLGLLDKDNNAFIPVDADFKPIGTKFAAQAGQWVEVTGTVVKTKGVTYLKISDPIPSTGDNGSKMDKDGDSDVNK
jgi:hypothetical protein